MNEFKQKLEEILNRLYKENKLSIDAYSELIEFADPNQALQLQQTGVSTCFSKLIGQEIFRKSPITKTYNKIKVKDIEFRLHARLMTIYLVIISENNIEYDFNDMDFGVNDEF